MQVGESLERTLSDIETGNDHGKTGLVDEAETAEAKVRVEWVRIVSGPLGEATDDWVLGAEQVTAIWRTSRNVNKL